MIPLVIIFAVFDPPLVPVTEAPPPAPPPVEFIDLGPSVADMEKMLQRLPEINPEDAPE